MRKLRNRLATRNLRHYKSRKAVSPVLATVILIAVTLIAAIAVAGFVFGLFGTFTGSAHLLSQVVTCVHNGGPGGVGSCEISLTNTGSSSASVTGCAVYGYAGVLSATEAGGPLASQLVPAGTTSAAPVDVWCQASAAGAAGAMVTGYLTVPMGAPLAFMATYS